MKSLELSIDYIDLDNNHLIEDYSERFFKLKRDALFDLRMKLTKLSIDQEFKEFIVKSLRLTNGHVCIENKLKKINGQHGLDKQYGSIVNIQALQKDHELNAYFELNNYKLINNGLFIGCFIIKKSFFNDLNFSANSTIVKKRIIRGLNFIFRSIKSKSSFISKAELFGRLAYFGFEVIKEEFNEELLYFSAVKKRLPLYIQKRMNGFFIKLPRVCKNGEVRNFYKIRTMYPYAEYLQDYLYKVKGLQTGGKLKEDFRISKVGKFLRKYWIDEFPMLINLLKGDIKLFGVRPISKQYFDLYSEELKRLRIKTKPGLIPPFYADFPKTLNEIMESELKYLLEYEQRPVLTDIKYLLKVMVNIILKGYRSK